MALPTIDRERIYHHAMRGLRAIGCVEKQALRSAVDAVDDWVDAAATSYLNALPAAFRTASTVEEKYLILMYVLMRRMNALPTEEDV